METAIGQGLGKVLGYLCGKYNVTKVLLAGGVSANGEIRRQVGSALTKQGCQLWAPEPRYSVDGAVGTAWYTAQKEGRKP